MVVYLYGMESWKHSRNISRLNGQKPFKNVVWIYWMKSVVVLSRSVQVLLPRNILEERALTLSARINSGGVTEECLEEQVEVLQTERKEGKAKCSCRS